MWVIKLGGSLAAAAELPRWIDVIAAAPGRAVIVPGGGPWADAVRAAQEREGFDDRVAHRRALAAMEGYAEHLIAMSPALVPAATRHAIDAALRRARAPVWLPSVMVLGDARIPESWEVSSDSLAAWLARALGAEALVLVKSMFIEETEASAEELARRGWVDTRLAQFSAGGCPVRLLGAGDQPRLARMLAGKGIEGLRMHAHPELSPG